MRYSHSNIAASLTNLGADPVLGCQIPSSRALHRRRAASAVPMFPAPIFLPPAFRGAFLTKLNASKCLILLVRPGVRQQVVDALLGHTAGSPAGVVGIYQLHDYEQEKREAVGKRASRKQVERLGYEP